MNLFKRAILNLIRQSGKNIILLVLIFILGTVLSGAMSIGHAIITTEENLMMRMPAVATLTFDVHAALEANPLADRERISSPTREEMSAVASLSYVRVYDFTIATTLWSRDLFWVEMELDEERLPSTESLQSLSWFYQGARSRGAYIENFAGIGVNNPDITDMDAELITLVSGRTFTQEEIDYNAMVIVVSQAFATTNNLEVGSLVTFENIAHNELAMSREGTGVFELDRHDERFIFAAETLEFEVVGIFEIVHEFVYEGHEEWYFSTALDEYSRLYNRIYIPIGIAEGMRNFVATTILEQEDEILKEFQDNPALVDMIEEPWLQSIFVLYDPRNLASFSVEASALLPEFWMTGDISTVFAPIVSSMDVMLDIAHLVQWATIGASLVILTLIIILFLRDRRHEIGIYMALGDKKHRVMVQILIEIGLVAIVGIALALFTGNMISNTLSRQMFEQRLVQQMESEHVASPIPWELALFNPGAMSVDEVMEMYDVSLDATIIFTFIGVGSGVILASTVIPIWYVVKLNPKKVLM